MGKDILLRVGNGGHCGCETVAHQKSKQDCFLQKEARVCVSNAFVLEDGMYK